MERRAGWVGLNESTNKQAQLEGGSSAQQVHITYTSLLSLLLVRRRPHTPSTIHHLCIASD
jgi:hypothetical protein